MCYGTEWDRVNVYLYPVVARWMEGGRKEGGSMKN